LALQKHNYKAEDKENSGVYIGILYTKDLQCTDWRVTSRISVPTRLEAVYGRYETGRRSSDRGDGQSCSGGRVCACVDGAVSFLVVAHAVTCVLLSAINWELHLVTATSPEQKQL
jgi:hypothetical protein